MPRVVLTHAVVDIERWLKGKSERAETIESGSGSNVTDYVAEDGSNNIAVTADVSDLAAMRAMLASPSPDVLARMEAHGVVPPIAAYIVSRSPASLQRAVRILQSPPRIRAGEPKVAV
ncbi:MAG: hypothetical protein ACXVQ3_03790 [Gaiellaceae bacterium]